MGNQPMPVQSPHRQLEIIMAAGPTQAQINASRRRATQRLATALGERLKLTPVYSGRGPTFQAVVGAVTVNTKFRRASNGEGCLWATAHSDKGSLLSPGWCEDGATVDNIVERLL